MMAALGSVQRPGSAQETQPEDLLLLEKCVP